ncbi:MAG: HAD family hydrolase, partial [Odoribacter sp.]
PKGGSISLENLAAFQQTGEQGVVRIIATGRSLYAARKVLPADFPIDYLVFSSGAGVVRWSDQQILFARHLDPQTTQDIAEYLWNYNINFTIQKEIPDNHYFYYTDIYPLHPDYKHRLETYSSFGTAIHSPMEIHGKSTQLIMILDGSQLRLLEQVRCDLKQYSVVRSTSPVDNQAIWLEIFPFGINKGTTCRSLLEQLGISCEQIAGLGNDYNDVDFLDICPQAYLVANAPHRLLPHYKSVASDRNNGFTEFISKVM